MGASKPFILQHVCGHLAVYLRLILAIDNAIGLALLAEPTQEQKTRVALHDQLVARLVLCTAAVTFILKLIYFD